MVGASVGAVVAGAYASGNTDAFEQWISGLQPGRHHPPAGRQMTGGFLQGNSLMGAIEKRIGNPNIEDLRDSPSLAWLPNWAPAARSGCARARCWTPAGRRSRCRAVRAVALHPDRLLIDGGVVNPVPVSLARAMGGDVVIAVNLNGDLIGRHFFVHGSTEEISDEESERELAEIEQGQPDCALGGQDEGGFRRAAGFLHFLAAPQKPGPRAVRRDRRLDRHHAGPHHALTHVG